MLVKRSIRVKEELLKDVKHIALEKSTTDNMIIEEALKQYRDNYYMKNKSTIINVSEHRINFKTNKFLSELVVQTVITNLIIAKSLEVSAEEVNIFRLKALDFLKENQRVLRLDELLGKQ